VPRLPLFPLPVVLFPDAPLPLHVFEPRYRRMLEDCLAGDRRFGMIYLERGRAERDLPAGQVGCVARVETVESLPDGRSNVAAIGVERFALRRLADDPAPYHVGEVETFDDVGEVPDATLEARVRATFERVARAARTLADDPSPTPPLPADAARLSFAVAALVDLELPARQRLLASRSPSDRLRQLDAVLSPAVDAVEERAAVHRRAKTNGHGPHGAHG
jgi:Lon protease-like protein